MESGYLKKIVKLLILFQDYGEYFESVSIRNTSFGRWFPNLRININFSETAMELRAFRMGLILNQGKYIIDEKRLEEDNKFSEASKLIPIETKIECCNFSDMYNTAQRIYDDFSSYKILCDISLCGIEIFPPSTNSEILKIIKREDQCGIEAIYCNNCQKIPKEKAVHYKGDYRTKKKIQKTYLMFDGTLYKIGKSTNPELRLRDIQAQNINTKLLHIIDKDIENELHRKYYNKRIHHEWFDLNKNDVSEILQTGNCGPDAEV